jgi:hypothetical protein
VTCGVWRPVVVLAVGLVLASAAAVAAVTWAVAAVPVSLAFVLGSVLASTDPVAVSALGRRLSLPPRVQALVQAESLFNDGTSLVLFQIAVSFAVAGTVGTAGGVLVHAAGSESPCPRSVPVLVARCPDSNMVQVGPVPGQSQEGHSPREPLVVASPGWPERSPVCTVQQYAAAEPPRAASTAQPRL